MAKIELSEIVAAAAEKGWSLLSEEYKNLNTPLEFVCNEGHHVQVPYKSLRGKDKWDCPVCQANEYYRRGAAQDIVAKPKYATRVLGLDQATNLSGYSIFEDGRLIDYGTFAAVGSDEIARDARIKEWIISLIKNWDIDFCGIEGIQYQQYVGVTTFQTLARLQGILMETCHSLGVQYLICPTNTWRKEMGVTGRARADRKKSARLIVKKLYDISVSEDEADAILIGGFAAKRSGTKLTIE